MTFVMVCVGCPLSSTVLLHGVLDSSCVCLLAYTVEAGVHFTSLPSLMVFKFFLSFHHIPTECWTAAPPACFALNAQVCNTHARTHARTHTQSTQHVHTHNTHISHSHLFLFYLLPSPPSSARTTAVQFLNTLCFPCRFDSDADASSREQQTPSCWESSRRRRRGRRRNE